MEVLLLGGTPIRGSVVQYSPSVMNPKVVLIEALDQCNAPRFEI